MASLRASAMMVKVGLAVPVVANTEHPAIPVGAELLG